MPRSSDHKASCPRRSQPTWKSRMSCSSSQLPCDLGSQTMTGRYGEHVPDSFAGTALLTLVIHGPSSRRSSSRSIDHPWNSLSAIDRNWLPAETVLAHWPLPFLLLFAPGGGKEHLWFTGFCGGPSAPDIASGKLIIYPPDGIVVTAITGPCDKEQRRLWCMLHRMCDMISPIKQAPWKRVKLARREVKPERGIFERPKGSGDWWINYYVNGTQHREKAGTRSDAKALYKERKA